jgi:hypothetical protein
VTNFSVVCDGEYISINFLIKRRIGSLCRNREMKRRKRESQRIANKIISILNGAADMLSA